MWVQDMSDIAVNALGSFDYKYKKITVLKACLFSATDLQLVYIMPLESSSSSTLSLSGL